MPASTIEGVILAPLEVHEDERGRFEEIFRGSDARFVQSNHSHSRQGVLRGLHFHGRQSDLCFVVSGEVQVALVDLRAGSGDPSTETFVLSGERPTTLFLPPGVAHGFLALTEVHLMYWMTELYDGSDEHGIAWDDSRLAIEWKIADPLVSQRDRLNKGLDWAEIPTFS